MHCRSAPRRRHSAELRAQVLSQCDAPGASVAAVAQAHGLNANLVHKWRRQSRSAPRLPSADIDHKSTGAVGTFVALQLPAVRAPAAPADIRIEVRRGATTVNIAWPTDAAGDCTAWLREWLR